MSSILSGKTNLNRVKRSYPGNTKYAYRDKRGENVVGKTIALVVNRIFQAKQQAWHHNN
jgi:hypothetical protein